MMMTTINRARERKEKWNAKKKKRLFVKAIRAFEIKWVFVCASFRFHVESLVCVCAVCIVCLLIIRLVSANETNIHISQRAGLCAYLCGFVWRGHCDKVDNDDDDER